VCCKKKKGGGHDEVGRYIRIYLLLLFDFIV
jgi:hypothetical protein